jgi:acetolactate synthase-1/2/3 large subunit
MTPRDDLPQTGAQSLARALARDGATIAFAYPGTTELAICAALGDHGITVINSRGDKEAVFMAAGANRLDRQRRAVAVLHGARGLTNALGAICDVRRSETPVLCLTGTASRHTARYLPPHAEPDLISSAARFAAHTVDFAEVRQWDHQAFTRLLDAGLRMVDGPALLGLPQDLAETAFIPAGASPPLSSVRVPAVSTARLSRARALIREARRPVVFIDDYLLTDDGTAETLLGTFAQRLGAPVYQVAYRRGPMLFQHATPRRVPTLAGLYDPADPAHTAVLAQADLLITVEDRNMYPRVVGPLPSCPAIIISSRPEAAIKNGYTTDNTVILHGPPAATLRRLTNSLSSQLPATQAAAASVPARPPDDHDCQALVTAISAGLTGVPSPVVVDDSQSFGALIARHYPLLPASTRVLGSHGGFVGSGMATAVGAALAGHRVLCLLGDQGFTNAVQALAPAAASRGLVIIVCNNGASQSLSRQAYTDGHHLSPGTALLRNPASMAYTKIAAGYGITSRSLTWPCPYPPGTAPAGLRLETAARLTSAIRRTLSGQGPSLIELVMCECPSLWSGLWRAHGADEPQVGRLSGRSGLRELQRLPDCRRGRLGVLVQEPQQPRITGRLDVVRLVVNKQRGYTRFEEQLNQPRVVPGVRLSDAVHEGRHRRHSPGDPGGFKTVEHHRPVHIVGIRRQDQLPVP